MKRKGKGEGKERRRKIWKKIGKIRGKGKRDFGGIFRVSGADVTSCDSRVGDDCRAGESKALAGMRARGIPGVGRPLGVTGVEKGRRHDDRVFRN
jgi:hypothetical protein